MCLSKPNGLREKAEEQEVDTANLKKNFDKKADDIRKLINNNYHFFALLEKIDLEDCFGFENVGI